MFNNFIYTLLDVAFQPEWLPEATLNNTVNNSTTPPQVEGFLNTPMIVLVIAGILIIGLTVFFLIKNKKKNGDDKS